LESTPPCTGTHKREVAALRQIVERQNAPTAFYINHIFPDWGVTALIELDCSGGKPVKIRAIYGGSE
jgi:hypothetical protein